MGWEAYASLEPFDEIRADYRAAQVAAMVFNMAVAVNDRKSVGEFLLSFGESESEPESEEQRLRKQVGRSQTPEEQLALIKALALMHAVPALDT